MKISIIVGNALMFKYLAYEIQKEFNSEQIQIIVENTYSKENFKKQIIFRIKKYGIIKFIDEVLYRLYESIIQKNKQIYNNHFQESEKLLIDYFSKNINDIKTEQIIKKFNPDILIIFGTSIIKENIFSIPKYGTLNIHPGVNPKYKGAGSFWALKNKDLKNYGFTIHLVDRGIDTGKIIISKVIDFKQKHKILPNMYVDLTKEASKELVNVLSYLKNNDKLPDNQPLTNEKGYYTWLGLSDYIKMRWNLRNVRI